MDLLKKGIPTDRSQNGDMELQDDIVGEDDLFNDYDMELGREMQNEYCPNEDVQNEAPKSETNTNFINGPTTFMHLLPTFGGDDDALSKMTELDSIKFTKKPKPINMSLLKKAILTYFQDKLKLDNNGNPTLDEETAVPFGTLVIDVCRLVDPKMVEHLSVAIIVVALLHVVVDCKLFLVPGEESFNPTIVCKGKLFEHKDYIPLPAHEVLEF